MPGRSEAREVAFQILYEDDLNPGTNPARGDAQIEQSLPSDELIQFAKDLVAGARRNRPEIDEKIEAAAENWTLERMATTDRNVIRLGAYELLHTDIPQRVAINEAIELAKRFGTAQSAHFVNGILDRLMHGQEGEGRGKREEGSG